MWEQVSQALNQSVTRVVTRIATLLPGVLALIVALLVSWGIASLICTLLRRFLRGVGFDGKMERWGMTDLSDVAPRHSPTELAIRVVFWGVIFIGFLIGATAFEATLTTTLVSQLFTFLRDLAVAAVVLLAGSVAARFLARSVLISAVNLNVQYARLLSVGMKWLVLVLAGAMALNHLGIGGKIVDEAFTILFGGIVLTLALAVGMGARDLVSRSLERQVTKTPEESDETFRHV